MQKTLRGMIESLLTPNSTTATIKELQAVLVIATCNWVSQFLCQMTQVDPEIRKATVGSSLDMFSWRLKWINNGQTILAFTA